VADRSATRRRELPDMASPALGSPLRFDHATAAMPVDNILMTLPVIRKAEPRRPSFRVRSWPESILPGTVFYSPRAALTTAASLQERDDDLLANFSTPCTPSR
jgi:hypothetical protein